jgi:PAS domain S-box-containing protein
VGIFRTDKTGRVLYGNQRFREITGGTGIGENLGSLVHPDDHVVMWGRWTAALERNEKFQFEIRWGSRESFRWAMGEAVPELIDNDVFGFIGVLTDVTERREQEAEKLRAAEEVRAQQELAIGIPPC